MRRTTWIMPLSAGCSALITNWRFHSGARYGADDRSGILQIEKRQPRLQNVFRIAVMVDLHDIVACIEINRQLQLFVLLDRKIAGQA